MIILVPTVGEKHGWLFHLGCGLKEKAKGNIHRLSTCWAGVQALP